MRGAVREVHLLRVSATIVFAVTESNGRVRQIAARTGKLKQLHSERVCSSSSQYFPKHNHENVAKLDSKLDS